eukprot:TRINITY_DN20086_c0_g1_i2.p1 TRINITY_DN20086_c0_g1~~TRINITY_DN20086_c0_g1_i2.p1  ORF type:complete len:656 (+),score=135.09 TRINITY_DN20086_c0_g1_i2:329-2296(+)
MHKARAQRKRWQVESIATVIRDLVTSSTQDRQLRVCDFGCGSGNFGLPLAAMLPDVAFTLVDVNAYAVTLAEQKATKAGLTNVDRFLTCSIADLPLEEHFDIAVAMHACGEATDFAQAAALSRGVPYVLCPCCIGKLQSTTRNPSTFSGLSPGQPQSSWLQHLGFVSGSDIWTSLIQACDHTSDGGGELPPSLAGWFNGGASVLPIQELDAHLCDDSVVQCIAKAILESDRNSFAAERCGYGVLLAKLVPFTSSTKNDVIVGIPPGNPIFAQTLQYLTDKVFEADQRDNDLVAEHPASQAPPSSIDDDSLTASALAALPYHVDQSSTQALGCQFWIRRGARTCKLMAADGSRYCSQHQPAALEKERQKSKQADLRHKQGQPPRKHKSALPRVSATQSRMANPFSRSTLSENSSHASSFPNWTQVFANPTLPVMLDIGSARGGCMASLSAEEPGWNFIGLEIRSVLVTEALAQHKKNRPNLHYLAMNCMDEPEFAAFLDSFCNGAVAAVCVQFPDPWTKSSRQRRRIVNSSLCSALASSAAVRDGCWVYVSSDVPDVVRSAAEALGSQGFEWCKTLEGNTTPLSSWRLDTPKVTPDGLLSQNPLGTGSPSERELSLIHISEPTRLLSISYAVFCLKKKKNKQMRTDKSINIMSEKQ